MRFLILVEDYPNCSGGAAMRYVHSRNVYYKMCGMDFEVLSFQARQDYEMEGIKVITLNSYIKSKKHFDLLVLHAANLKHHYCFLQKYGGRFRRYLFIFHGHEVLMTRKVYSKPYFYKKGSAVEGMVRDIYDRVKLRIWHHFFMEHMDKSRIIFVSAWMYRGFLKWVRIPARLIRHKYWIVYNNVGDIFERESYDAQGPKEYDYITIRGNIDHSKYAVDVVNKLARHNRCAKFLLVGEGEYFKHNQKAGNITWVNKTLDHREMIQYLNKAKCALMPTRTDAQGVTACEIATFGMPLITSDIDVCHEVFEGFFNVHFIDNHAVDTDLELLRMNARSQPGTGRNKKFYSIHTVDKEVRIINRIIKNDMARG